MLKRVTTLFALLCMPAVASLAQQKLVISSGNHNLPQSINVGKAIDAKHSLRVNKGIDVNAPYIHKPLEIPSALLADTTIEGLTYFTRTDYSDTSVVKDGNPLGINFTGISVTAGGGTEVLYTVVGLCQFVDPVPGSYTIDSLSTFIFREGGSTGTPIKNDVYLFPFIVPNSTPYSQLAIDFTGLQLFPGDYFVTIPKDSLNSPERYKEGSLWLLSLDIPDLEVPANTRFGFAVFPGDWFENRTTGDRLGMISSFEWDLTGEQTSGGIIRTNNSQEGDTLETAWRANLRFGEGERIKQNFDFRMVGTYKGEWPITDVRQDENGSSTVLALEANYPNPAANETHIRFSVNKTAPVTLRLTNMLGQVVATSADTYSTGSYIWDVQTSHLPAGTYIYSLSVGDQTLTRTMTIVR